MPNFELTLTSYCDDAAGHAGSSPATTRVIAADDITLARRVGEAMIGEEVASSERFTTLRSVEETDKEPELGAWSPDHVWKRVLKELDDDRVLLVSQGDKTIGVTTTVQTC